jgi:hypothetical protein
MAKGQVTDQELETGLQSLGGLGGIAASGARRDSPFGAGFVKKSVPESNTRAEATEAKLQVAANVAVVAPVAQEVVPSRVEAIAPSTASVVAVGEHTSTARRPRAVEAPMPADVAPVSSRKSDSFSERVTLQMSPEMRDELTLLAARLQRRKTDKTERITANTIMRVAIQMVLDEIDFGEGDIINSEVDLDRVVRAKLSGR